MSHWHNFSIRFPRLWRTRGRERNLFHISLNGGLFETILRETVHKCFPADETELAEWEWHATCSRQFDSRYCERITRRTVITNSYQYHTIYYVFDIIKREVSQLQIFHGFLFNRNSLSLCKFLAHLRRTFHKKWKKGWKKTDRLNYVYSYVETMEKMRVM